MIETEGSMTAREELHQLVDYIPENDLSTTRKLLRALVDPVELAVLSAEEDDEPESPSEHAAVEAALADTAPDIPFERLRRVRHGNGSYFGRRRRRNWHRSGIATAIWWKLRSKDSRKPDWAM